MKLLELETPLQHAEHAFGTAEASSPDLAQTIRGYTEVVGPIAYMRQVHGDRIVYTKEAGCVEEADAIYTDDPDLWLGVSTADCAPVLISCPHAVAAVHCGWRGLQAEILPKTINKLIEEYNVTGIDIFIHIGPCLTQKHYIVEDSFKKIFNEKNFEPAGKKGFTKMSLVGIITEQAKQCGVPAANINDCGLCTFEDSDLFNSHRRNKAEGKDEYQVQVSIVRRAE